MNSFSSNSQPEFESAEAIAQSSIIFGKYRGNMIAFQGHLSQPQEMPNSALLLRYRGVFYLKPH
ncbi:MAG: hypothetical protein SNJ57_15330 [Cyanobacteriota bacterium]